MTSRLGLGSGQGSGKFGYAINDADLSHDALADNAGHKVSGTS